MTDDRMALVELLQKSGEGDFLRAVAEAVLQILMEADIEGVIGASRQNAVPSGSITADTMLLLARLVALQGGNHGSERECRHLSRSSYRSCRHRAEQVGLGACGS